MVYTLMKGASTVGTIFNAPSVKPDQVVYDEIISEGDGVFTITNFGIISEQDTTFYTVFNIRGVETDYTHSQAEIIVKERKTWFTYIFNVFEPFIAFGISTMIIVSASYGFPIILIPLCYIMMGVFMYYVYS
jgi:hypothetical protein